MRAATLLLILMTPVAALAAERAFTEDFPLKSCQFTAREGNKYFPLVPGRQLYYNNSRCVSEGECEELEELWITTEFQTRRITLGSGAQRRHLTTRVVEERETEDGELKEISRNFVALCTPSRDLYYFGEEVDIYEDGEIVSHDGAWIAGRHGALPGIIMPDSAFLLGTRYFQELAPGSCPGSGRTRGYGSENRCTGGHFQRLYRNSRDLTARGRARSPPSFIVPESEWSSTTSWSSRRSTKRQWRGGPGVRAVWDSKASAADTRW